MNPYETASQLRNSGLVSLGDFGNRLSNVGNGFHLSVRQLRYIEVKARFQFANVV
jgi:hypothetical protein